MSRAAAGADRWSLKCRSRLSWQMDSSGFVWLWINHREQLRGAGGAQGCLCGSGDVHSPLVFHPDLIVRLENGGERCPTSAGTK